MKIEYVDNYRRNLKWDWTRKARSLMRIHSVYVYFIHYNHKREEIEITCGNKSIMFLSLPFDQKKNYELMRKHGFDLRNNMGNDDRMRNWKVERDRPIKEWEEKQNILEDEINKEITDDVMTYGKREKKHLDLGNTGGR